MKRQVPCIVADLSRRRTQFEQELDNLDRVTQPTRFVERKARSTRRLAWTMEKASIDPRRARVSRVGTYKMEGELAVAALFMCQRLPGPQEFLDAYQRRRLLRATLVQLDEKWVVFSLTVAGVFFHGCHCLSRSDQEQL